MSENFVIQDRQEKLAHSLIEEFLHRMGYSLETISQLPPEEVKQLMIKASIYVSTRLAEVEGREEVVTGIHHATEALT
jgi:hypothetical protein